MSSYAHLYPKLDPADEEQAAAQACHWRPLGTSASSETEYERKAIGSETFTFISRAADPKHHCSTITCSAAVSLRQKDDNLTSGYDERVWKQIFRAAWIDVALRLPFALLARQDRPDQLKIRLPSRVQEIEQWADDTVSFEKADHTQQANMDALLHTKEVLGCLEFPTSLGNEAKLHVLPANEPLCFIVALQISHSLTDGSGALAILKLILQHVVNFDGNTPAQIDLPPVSVLASRLLPGFSALVREDARPKPEQYESITMQQVCKMTGAGFHAFKLHFDRPFPPSEWGATLNVVEQLSEDLTRKINAFAKMHNLNVSFLIHAAWGLTNARQNTQEMRSDTTMAGFVAINSRRAFPLELQDPTVSAQGCVSPVSICIPIGAATADFADPTERLLMLSKYLADEFKGVEKQRGTMAFLSERWMQRLIAAHPAGEAPAPVQHPILVADGKYDRILPPILRSKKALEVELHTEAILMGIDHGGPVNVTPIGCRWWSFRDQLHFGADFSEGNFEKRQVQKYLSDWKKILEEVV
ncbi:hypothetical protein IE81DRAFT_363406 [Ceraceosorus guamensis]|uniref:CoA-dependent acyltransferase n=1 Tax=Ceraceosorus guamensis TaxID=1522189 RepID=A0A316WBW6_9BASI|nr:hypothetical protein IE81DRAFT_363406 [Ceraceosorus guamensis]PWN46428.1 hypothetical protein IE81DRAFT_363406 [Ceraceosorus guamensis]